MRFRQRSGAKNIVGARRHGNMVRDVAGQDVVVSGWHGFCAPSGRQGRSGLKGPLPDAVPEACPQISGDAAALSGRIPVRSLPTLRARAAFFLEIAGIVA